MLAGALGNDGNDAGDSQLGTLFDGPFHAVELEHCKRKRDMQRRSGGYFFSELKLNSIILNGDYPCTPNGVAGYDIELLAKAGTQDAREMMGMGSYKGGAAAADFIGDPAAAGHQINLYPKISLTFPSRVRFCGLFSTRVNWSSSWRSSRCRLFSLPGVCTWTSVKRAALPWSFSTGMSLWLSLN